MIYCKSPTLEQWLAPPQEDFPRPTWTKLIADGVMLSNSIEYADWVADPVQPIVCEGCWSPSCAQAGLARIVHIADHVLWLPPRLHDIDESWREVLSEANFIREAVLLPVTAWEGLRVMFPCLPAAQSYSQAVRGDLAALWLREMPEAMRVVELGGVEARLREALASDPLDLDPAREVVRSLVGWIIEGPGQPVGGELVRSQDCGDVVNTFYFDGPPFPEWPAFVVGRNNSFALGSDVVFHARDGSA